MANIIHRPSWHLPERLVTPEHVFLNRRRFMRQVGLAAGAGTLSALAIGCGNETPVEPVKAVAAAPKTSTPATTEPVAGYPAKRNPAYNPDWELTDEETAATYNNFYEFTLGKDVYKYCDAFKPKPWEIEISGLVEQPITVDPFELAEEFSLEERVYRFRCVEAWAMVVPWTGFQLSKLIEKAKPKAEAKFVRMETVNRPSEMPGIGNNPNYPWPYFEALRMDEAMHPLTFMATGIYGKPMPNQHGAPIRLVVPWKYGYKSIKSIVKIEFVAEQPKIFWEAINPVEYPFESNVNPDVPHPRWSQATHRVLGESGRERTLYLNGYADEVGDLYPRA